MPISCVASNCSNRLHKGSGKSFHRFPFSRPHLVEQWLVNIRREGWKPSKYSHICSDHFDDDCYIGGPHRRRILKADAVPTKFNYDSEKVARNLLDHSEKEKLDNIDDSANPLENGLLKMPVEVILHEDQSAKQELKVVDITKLQQNGISQVQEENFFGSEDNYSRNSLSKEELYDVDDRSRSSSDSSVFPVKRKTFGSEDNYSRNSLSKEELYDVDDRSRSSSDSSVFRVKRKTLPSKSKIWSPRWSDNVFVEDFLDNEKLSLSTSNIIKKKSVKTRKVVYYGELINCRTEDRLKAENALPKEHKIPYDQQTSFVSERKLPEDQKTSCDQQTFFVSEKEQLPKEHKIPYNQKTSCVSERELPEEQKTSCDQQSLFVSEKEELPEEHVIPDDQQTSFVAERELPEDQNTSCDQQTFFVSVKEEKNISDHASTSVKKEESKLSSYMHQADSIIPNIYKTDEESPNHLVKTECEKHAVLHNKIFESDNVIVEQKINNCDHHLITNSCESNGSPVMEPLYNHTTGQETNEVSQNNELSSYQLDTMDVDASTVGNSNKNGMFKIEKKKNGMSANPVVLNGHTYNISLSKSEMKRQYDKIICTKDKQLSVLRKRVKRYKKILAKKNKTIATLNTALIDLDFMNPRS